MLNQWLIGAAEWGMVAAALVLLVPIGVLFVECIAALLPARSPLNSNTVDQRTAILMPAHNEAVVIADTLTSVTSHCPDTANIYVVADNCTDETAAIARRFDVTVFERHDQAKRGKGYALDYGLSCLSATLPETVVMVDADCTVDAFALARLSSQAQSSSRPIQGVYLMEVPPNPSPSDSISALAFLVKNWVRPAGLARLGLPCLLTGTGMAFPWPIIKSAPLASGNIVEDMQLGLDLAIAGYPPQFCAAARLTGRLPSDADAANSQRTRWEHGQLSTLTTQVPRLLKEAVHQRRFDLLALALEMLVPPLSLLVLMWSCTLMISGVVALAGFTRLPVYICAVEGLLIAIAIVAAWVKFGRHYISGAALLMAPLYVAWKIPLYIAFVVRRQTDWVRTKRDVT
ncbi:MAG: glycosyltransferase [Elainellaceae cyanobacterium]